MGLLYSANLEREEGLKGCVGPTIVCTFLLRAWFCSHLFASISDSRILCCMMGEIKDSPRDSSPYEKDVPVYEIADDSDGVANGHEAGDGLHRNLSGRQIQMITIGGSIGTALFVSIGSGLVQGGPGSLLIAFAMYSCWLALVNNCMAEMAVCNGCLVAHQDRRLMVK